MVATLNVSTIQNASSSTPNIQLDTAGNATVGGGLIMSGSGSFLRNRIINGDMSIAQRGTSFTSPASNAYTLDRWFIGWAGATPASVAQVAGTAGYRYAVQITGATGNTVTTINQRIESYNCDDLSGATVTIQANISVSTAQTLLWSIYYPTAQDNWVAAATLITSGSWSATTTATTFTATITNLPAGATNGLQLSIAPNNGNAFTSGTITITGVQLEVGAIATPFERELYSVTLAKCQRFYYVGSVSNYGYPSPNSGGYAYVQRYDFKVTMRAVPTVSTNYGSLTNVVSVNPTQRTVDWFTDQIVSTTSTNTTWTCSYTATAEL